MTRYVFADDAPLPILAAKRADAQAIGAALQKIADKYDGRLNPEIVPDEAVAKSHPLHRHFEWDDALAGRAYRVQQARQLIRLIRVEPEDPDVEPPRAFLSIHSEGRTSYRALDSVRRSSDYQMILLRSARRDLESFRERYSGFRELFQDIDKVISRIDKRIGEEETADVAAG
jgi:hypothetical protein